MSNEKITSDRKKNMWIMFLKEYKLKHPDMLYGELLKKASKSPEWLRYKERNNKSIANDNDIKELLKENTILENDEIKRLKDENDKLRRIIKKIMSNN